MYATLFGGNPQAKVILKMLSLTPTDIGRFRDAFVSEGKILIYARLGGGNRDEYKEVIAKLQEHPCYLSDKDDNFDSTYASFYFSFPDKYKEILGAMEEGPIDTDKRWKDKLEEISNKSPQELKDKYPEITQVVEDIVKLVDNSNGDKEEKK